MFNLFFVNRAIYKTMWENMAHPERPQVTMQYGSCALHSG
jgi:hypothetical protein